LEGPPPLPGKPLPLSPLEPLKPFQVRPVRTPTQEEFDDLKKEMQELKELIKAAKKFDENTNQKDCEMEEKIALIKKVANAVGVNFDDVFAKKTNATTNSIVNNQLLTG
jgi:phytoene/squalene synthetase